MLHMIVNTHQALDCAFRGEAEERTLTQAVDGFTKAGPDAVMRVAGAWINRGGHEFFLLVDAPNAHVIEDALVASGLLGRTHSRIVSVLPADEVEVTR